MILVGFKGVVKCLMDIDVVCIVCVIGVSEDVLCVVIEVEMFGGGFDWVGCLCMLFELYVFYCEFGVIFQCDVVQVQGLVYVKWGVKFYLVDSYFWFELVMKISWVVVLCSVLWGFGQIMGFNYCVVGYLIVGDMVVVFCESEKVGFEVMVVFIVSENFDDDLCWLDWFGFVCGYNGVGYVMYGYYIKLVVVYWCWQVVLDVFKVCLVIC